MGITDILLLLKYPESVRLGFPSASSGIERRAKKLSLYWSPHFAASKSSQATWTEEIRSLREGRKHSLTVLGAGRLFDLNVSALTGVFDSLTLVDADPLCRKEWKRLARLNNELSIAWSIAESSGVIASWVSEFRKSCASQSWSEAMKSLRNFPEDSQLPASTFLRFKRSNAILSLNLLSQIPLVWQDNLQSLLKSRFGRRQVKENEQEWLDALLPSAKVLVEQHLRDLFRADAEHILLITDLECCFYDGTKAFDRRTFQQPPLIWNGSWQANSSFDEGLKEHHVSAEVYSSLYGIDLEQRGFLDRPADGYVGKLIDSWLWHIQPLGTEKNKRGLLHRVGAFIFRRA